jgi:hypothetical protein
MKRILLEVWGLATAILLLSVPSWAASDPDALCQGHRLDAVALYAKKVLYCWAHAAKARDTEADEGCIAEASAQLDARWTAADPHGTGCNSGAELEDILALIGGDCIHVDGGIDEVISGVLWGGDGEPGNEDDPIDLEDPSARTLADELLKASGEKAFELLKANAQDVQRPNSRKLASKISKAQAKFMRQAKKAMSKAQRKGVMYEGATAEDLEAIIDEMVDDIVETIQESPEPHEPFDSGNPW